jgi:hypothetical protein
MFAAVLPWPARSDRKAEIEKARHDRESAEHDLDRTLSAVDELRDIVYKGNHFADGIIRQLRTGYDRGCW